MAARYAGSAVHIEERFRGVQGYSGGKIQPSAGRRFFAGITFTFGGLKTRNTCQVLDGENNPIPGLYACGELMGGLFYYNYPGGSGLMSGSVFGKIAGEQSAQYAAGK